MHKRYTKDGEHLGTRLVPGLRGEIGIKSDKFALFQFLRYVRIDVQSGGNVSMSKGVLNHFYIYRKNDYSWVMDIAICSGVIGSSRNHLPVAR